jgi:hypothetical protein
MCPANHGGLRGFRRSGCTSTHVPVAALRRIDSPNMDTDTSSSRGQVGSAFRAVHGRRRAGLSERFGAKDAGPPIARLCTTSGVPGRLPALPGHEVSLVEGGSQSWICTGGGLPLPPQSPPRRRGIGTGTRRSSATPSFGRSPGLRLQGRTGLLHQVVIPVRGAGQEEQARGQVTLPPRGRGAVVVLQVVDLTEGQAISRTCPGPGEPAPRPWTVVPAWQRPPGGGASRRPRSPIL